MFKCHGNCGLYGDVIDLIGYMNIPGYQYGNLALKKQAAEILSGGRYEISEPIAPPPTPPLSLWMANKFLPLAENVRDYMVERGVPEAYLEKYKVGSASYVKDGEVTKRNQDLSVSLPVFHDGNLMGIKLRKIEPNGYRYFNVEGSQPALWNYDSVFLTDNVVFVVKGEIAGMVLQAFLDKHRLPAFACAPTHGEHGFVDKFVQVLSFAKTVVIGDNDRDPGIREKIVEATQKRAASLGGLLHFPYEGYKDIDEQILRDPSTSYEMLVRWIEEAKRYAI